MFYTILADKSEKGGYIMVIMWVTQSVNCETFFVKKKKYHLRKLARI